MLLRFRSKTSCATRSWASYWRVTMIVPEPKPTLIVSSVLFKSSLDTDEVFGDYVVKSVPATAISVGIPRNTQRQRGDLDFTTY